MYSKYQFEDEKAGWSQSKGKWHPYGMIMRLLFFAGLLLYKFFPFDYWDLLLSGVICIILWDVGINVFALRVKWDYVGKTDNIDKKVGKIKWYIYIVMLISSIFGKIFVKRKNKKP